MSALSTTIPHSETSWKLPARGPVAMYCLIAAEAAIFTIFVVAYIFYIGKSLSGPQPKDVLRVPIFFTVCLLSSSLTIHFAVNLLRSGKVRSFALWWFFTFALGAIFLAGTANEWRHLIYDEGLTIQTNPNQFVRDNLLFSRRPACVSRNCGPACFCCCNYFHVSRDAGRTARGTGRGVVNVLALRGCGVGCGFHCRVYNRALRREEHG
jgi:hypothetical protein